MEGAAARSPLYFRNARVDLREYGWVNSIEAAEELYRIFQERGI